MRGRRLASVGATHYLDDPVVAAGREAGDRRRRPGAVGWRAHDDDHVVPGADNLDELKPAAADDLGSADEPQRVVAARARPVRLAAMPIDVAVEEFTDGSDIAT